MGEEDKGKTLILLLAEAAFNAGIYSRLSGYGQEWEHRNGL